MIQKPVVDIVIPAYNAERSLYACIKSALVQQYPYIRIYLVDDGSSDRTPEICDFLAAKYSRVTAVHVQNGGPGKARNAGFSCGKGTFVCFLDADDALDGPCSIGRLVEKAVQEKADLCIGGFRRMRGKRELFESLPAFGEKFARGSEDFRFYGFYQSGQLSYPWGKIYRRSFLEKNAIVFPDYRIAEDRFFNYWCYVRGASYSFLQKSVYQYQEGSQTLTVSYIDNLGSIWNEMGRSFYKKLGKERKEYFDLAAYHYYFGGAFLVTQEKRAGHSFCQAVEKFREFYRFPLAKRSYQAIAWGSFSENLSDRIWRLAVRGTAFLPCAHLYALYTAGMIATRKYLDWRHDS
ncbi:MAG: glycosyltransferase family 2 protein [Eubacterium sp.]|nr:glycosyltransferase family 2 protein [Eubacterium sp.]